MAKRASSSEKKPASASKKVASVSPVRRTVTPRKTASKPAAAQAPLTHELVCERAYFISISGNGGSEADNWFRAEAELKTERGLV